MVIAADDLPDAHCHNFDLIGCPTESYLRNGVLAVQSALEELLLQVRVALLCSSCCSSAGRPDACAVNLRSLQNLAANASARLGGVQAARCREGPRKVLITTWLVATFSLLVLIGFSTFGANLATSLVSERENRMQHLLLVLGMPPSHFWCALSSLLLSSTFARSHTVFICRFFSFRASFIGPIT